MNNVPAEVTLTCMTPSTSTRQKIRGDVVISNSFQWELIAGIKQINGNFKFKPYIQIVELYPNSLKYGVTISNIILDYKGYLSDKITTYRSFLFGTSNMYYLDMGEYPIERDATRIKVTFTIIVNEFQSLLDAPNQMGFSYDTYFNSAEFSDVTLKVYKGAKTEYNEASLSSHATNLLNVIKINSFKEFKAHRCILAASSGFFMFMLTAGMQESHQKVISLYETDPLLFERILNFCYTQTIAIDCYKDGCAILVMCDYYQIKKLNDVILAKLVPLIDIDSIWYIWNIADTCSAELAKACRQLFCTATGSILTSKSWLSASGKAIQAALRSSKKVSAKEEDIYRAVVAWTKQQKDKIALQKLLLGSSMYPDEDSLRSDLKSILCLVRFPLLPTEVISEEVESNKFIMSIPEMTDHIIEAYRFQATGAITSDKCVQRGSSWNNK